MKLRTPFSAEFLRTVLRYNPNTGLWFWRKGKRYNKFAGHVDRGGYHHIGIKRQQYLASRLAVLYMTGAWPAAFVDHKDGNPQNNKWTNIRQASYSQNQWNKRGWSTKKKLKGAYFVRGKWRAIIGFNGRQVRLGVFPSEQEAHAAYVAASKRYHGEFGRVS